MGNPGAVSTAVCDRRENGLGKALEKDQPGANLKNRFGELIWSCSQITLSSLSTCRQEGQMLRKGLRVPKPVLKKLNLIYMLLLQDPCFSRHMEEKQL